MKDDAQVAPSAEMTAALGLEQKPGLASRLKHHKWQVAAGVVVVIGIAAFVLWPSGGEPTVSYRTAEVARGGLTVTVTASGALEPRNTVQVGPEISGLIETVLVDFNSPVTKGQTLARMDTDNVRARLALQRANLAAARARIEDAKATANESKIRLERIQELYKRGNSSKAELDTAVAVDERARAGLANAEAQVDVAAANLLTEETNLAKTEITSPIDGIVMLRQVEPGQAVAASLQTPVLFQVAEDLTAMELVVDVDEADIGQVKEGQAAEFTVAAYPERRFPATIAQVRYAPKTVEGVVTFQALLLVDNKDLLLRPGMTATATIVTVTLDDALLVPVAALRYQPPRAVLAGGEGAAPAGNPRAPGLLGMFGAGRRNNNERPSVVTQTRPGERQRLWVLEGGVPTPIMVTVGASDNQVVAVEGEGLEAGLEIIVGMQQAAPQ